MKPPTTCTWTPLAPQDLLTFTPGPGEDLAAARGRLWVTQTGDATDSVLVPGDTLPLQAGRRVVVEAFDAAVVRNGTVAPTVDRWARLRRLAARWWNPVASRPYVRPWHAPRRRVEFE